MVMSEKKQKRMGKSEEECDIEYGDLSSNNMGPNNLLKNENEVSIHDGSMMAEEHKTDLLQVDKPGNKAGKKDTDSSFNDEDLDIPDDDDFDYAMKMPEEKSKILQS